LEAKIPPMMEVYGIEESASTYSFSSSSAWFWYNLIPIVACSETGITAYSLANTSTKTLFLLPDALLLFVLYALSFCLFGE
jgi:hypothetical protein